MNEFSSRDFINQAFDDEDLLENDGFVVRTQVTEEDVRLFRWIMQAFPGLKRIQ